MELTATLESMNSELLEMTMDSEQQASEAQQLRERWVQEKNEMSGLVVQLRTSAERETKERMQLVLKVSITSAR